MTAHHISLDLNSYFFFCSASNQATFIKEGCYSFIIGIWPASRDETGDNTLNVTSHSLQESGKCLQTNTCVVGMYKHWDFPELVGSIAWFTSLSCYCTLCFGWLVSVMVRVVWATISTRNYVVSGCQQPYNQSINKALDVVDTKYSTNKRMALCYLSGWFYINANIKGYEGSL